MLEEIFVGLRHVCYPKFRYSFQNPSKLRETDSADFCAAKQGEFYGILNFELSPSWYSTTMHEKYGKMTVQPPRIRVITGMTPNCFLFRDSEGPHFIYSPLLLGPGSQFETIEVSEIPRLFQLLFYFGAKYIPFGKVTVKGQEKDIFWKIIQKKWIVDLSLLPVL